jgi:hypothetical protein
MKPAEPTTEHRRCGALSGLCYSVCWIVCFVSAGYTAPSSLSPQGTKFDQHLAAKDSAWWQKTVDRLTRQGLIYFGDPVHEEITNRIFGCDPDQEACNDPEDTDIAGPWVLAGVRWNDDPPFRLLPGQGAHTHCKAGTIRFTTQPICWVELFNNAKQTAAKVTASGGDIPSAQNHAVLLARSHFGDLQFFHAMASQDVEVAEETQRRVMIWMEFCWRVANRRIHC